jgi:dephospho-CoA kinase
MVRKNIAISGKFAVGKTSAAEILVNNAGYKRLSMAQPIKDFVLQAYGTIDKGATLTTYPDGSKSVRQVMQEVGQRMKEVDRNIWLKMLKSQIDECFYVGTPVVIDDMRFPFEAEFLRANGFIIARLTAPDSVRFARYSAIYGRPPSHKEIHDTSEVHVPLISADIEIDGEESPEAVADRLAALAEGESNG